MIRHLFLFVVTHTHIYRRTYVCTHTDTHIRNFEEKILTHYPLLMVDKTLETRTTNF